MDSEPRQPDASASKRAYVAAAPSPLCANCEYDLAGLPPEAPCPECGGTERMSASLLRRTPAWYRARLRLALNLLRFSILAIGAGPTAYIIMGDYIQTSIGTGAFGAASWLLAIICLVAFASSIFLLSTPILPLVNYAIAENARKWLRPTLLCGCLLIATGVACGTIPLSGFPNGNGLGATGLALTMIGLVTLLVTALMAIDYGVWLAACVPDPSLVRQGKTLLWLAPLLSILGLCFIALGPLVAGILVFIFLTKLRRRVMAPDLEAA